MTFVTFSGLSGPLLVLWLESWGLHFLTLWHIWGFPGGSDGKESACSAGVPGLILVRKIPWRRAWQSTPVFLPRESHGQRSLVGYSPWGHRLSDTTEWLTLTYPMAYFWLCLPPKPSRRSEDRDKNQCKWFLCSWNYRPSGQREGCCSLIVLGACSAALAIAVTVTISDAFEFWCLEV